jgi:porphyrinogen peroxidase
MSQPQSGILLEHCRFGIFIEALVQGDLDAVRQGCKTFVNSLQALQKTVPTGSFGSRYRVW